MSAIAKNIKAARLNADLTQAQLAEQIKVTRNYIAQLEMGRKKPGLKLISEIARATKTKISTLLKGDTFLEKLRADFLEEAEAILSQT